MGRILVMGDDFEMVAVDSPLQTMSQGEYN